MEERACRPVALPPTSEWHLHCDIYSASGLADLLGWSGNDIWIEINWGNQKISTEPGTIDNEDSTDTTMLFSTKGKKKKKKIYFRSFRSTTKKIFSFVSFNDKKILFFFSPINLFFFLLR